MSEQEPMSIETAVIRVLKGFKKIEEKIQQVERDENGNIVQSILPNFQKTKVKYLEKFNRSFDPTEQVKKETILEPEEEKIWRSREEKLMAAVIAIFSLMHRRDWLRLLGDESPEYYIKEIYYNLIGIEKYNNNEQYTKLERIFASEEVTTDPLPSDVSTIKIKEL